MEGQLNINRRADLIQSFAPIVLFFIVSTVLYLMNWVDSENIRFKAIENEKLEMKKLEMRQRTLSMVHHKIRKTRQPNPRPE